MKKLMNNYKKWNPSIYATILLLLTPFVLFLIKGFELDNDFWFLINTGKTILKEGFIRIEPFTIHEGLAFIPQQWLTDIIFYLIYDNFDIKGMLYLTIICNFLILILSYNISYLISNSRKKSLIISVIANIYLIIYGFLATRPQMFDIVFFSLEMYLLELFINKDNSKYLYFIPLISLLLINSHASMWPMLFVFILPYYVEYIYLRIKKKNYFKIKPLLIATLLSFFIGFINPYGRDAMSYLFNSYGIENINNIVGEMHGITVNKISGKALFIIITTVIYSFYRNKGNNKLRYFLLTIGTFYLGLSHYKGLIYFIIILPLVLSYNYKNNVEEYDIKILPYEKVVYIILMIGFVFLVIFKTELSKHEHLLAFANYLDTNASKNIRLYTDYNDGGYMEYRGYKCYIDPRAEAFLKSNNKKEDIFQEYYDINFNYDKESISDFLEKYHFDYLLIDSDARGLFRELNNSKEYEKVYDAVTDEEAKITHYLFKRLKT